MESPGSEDWISRLQGKFGGHVAENCFLEQLNLIKDLFFLKRNKKLQLFFLYPLILVKRKYVLCKEYTPSLLSVLCFDQVSWSLDDFDINRTCREVLSKRDPHKVEGVGKPRAGFFVCSQDSPDPRKQRATQQRSCGPWSHQRSTRVRL